MIEQTDTRESAPTLEDRNSKPWYDLIREAERVFADYHAVCDNVEREFSDLKRHRSTDLVRSDREMQVFWANLEVLKPSIYARPAVPVVTPRFRERKEISRVASEVLERALISSFDNEALHEDMKDVRDDLALCARGVLWLEYEQSADGERVFYDSLNRRDFMHEPARKWKEVGWVAKRAFLTREEGVKRFGTPWLQANFTTKETDKGKDYKTEEKAAVWEIWHKQRGVVVWVSEHIDTVLDAKAPWLRFPNFFPCPKPVYGTLQRNSLIPVPDFAYYRDQIEEINELTARISDLAESLRLKGFYDAGAEDLSTAIEKALRTNDNRAVMVPVSANSSLSGAKLADAVVWLPIKEVAATIVSCIELRKQLIDDVYQITGLSDIMRGATNPNETLGAQELKSQYGSIRIRDRQNEMIRIARDAAEMAAEIIAENFSPEMIETMSQMQLPHEQEIQQQIAGLVQQAQQAVTTPEAQQAAAENPQLLEQAKQQLQQQIAQLEQVTTFEKVVQLLRSEKTRPFILDIETDSTIQPNEDAEKQRRTEYLTAVGGFINQATPAMQAFPESGAFIAESLKFVASTFRAGRSMDAAIDDLAEKIKQTAGQPKPPSPEQVKAEAEKAKIEAELQKTQIEAKAKIDEHAMKMQEMQAEAEFKKDEMAFKRTGMFAENVQSKKRAKREEMVHNMTIADKLADRKHKEKLAEYQLQGDRAKAGIPPDYSFEDDRQQFRAMQDMLMKSEVQTQQLMQSMAQQNQMMIEALTALVKAATAPRRMRGPSGREYTSEMVN